MSSKVDRYPLIGNSTLSKSGDATVDHFESLDYISVPIMTRKTQQHVFTFVPVSASTPLPSLPIVLECGFHHLLHSQSFYCLTRTLRTSPLSFEIPTGPFAPSITFRVETLHSLFSLIIEQGNTIKPLSINLLIS
jgi:hypothetical protein